MGDSLKIAMVNQWISGFRRLIITGWWCNNHLEKYDSQWEGLSHILCKKKCSKPPTRSYVWTQISSNHQENHGVFIGGSEPMMSGNPNTCKANCEPLELFEKYILIPSYSGWWFEPLWKILVSWGYYSQYMDKTCSKPQNSIILVVQ